MTELGKRFGDAFTTDVPLAPLTTLKVGGPAEGLLTVNSLPELTEALITLKKFHVRPLVLGRGANLLVPDAGFRGCVLRLKGAFEAIEKVRSSQGMVYLRAGAGVSLPRLVTYAARHGLSGLEPFTAIPGTVGGAVVMNAGVPEASISDVLSSVTCLPPALEPVKRHVRRLHPSHRDMGLPGDWIVLHATFRLRPDSESAIRERMREFLRKRAGQMWRKFPSAGSIFRNPEGTFAGKLIEACGLKGLRIGGAQVSPDHANIIVNRGSATASDILALIAQIRAEVEKKTGIKLELEVVIARN